MEKRAVVAPGVTPEVKETEKRACGCGCGCKRALVKLTPAQKIERLEDDAVGRLVKKAAGK